MKNNWSGHRQKGPKHQEKGNVVKILQPKAGRRATFQYSGALNKRPGVTQKRQRTFDRLLKRGPSATNELWDVIANSGKSFLFFLKKGRCDFGVASLKDHEREVGGWSGSPGRLLSRSEHNHYESWFFVFFYTIYFFQEWNRLGQIARSRTASRSGGGGSLV